MTDAEISRALALAIGWPTGSVYQHSSPEPGCQVWRDDGEWCDFDYRDPAVIWPIAERYNAFPAHLTDGKWCATTNLKLFLADTAAEAVARAVIGGKE